MKLLKLLFIPAFVFGFDIEFSKKFHHILPEDTLSANLIITIEDETESEINSRFKVFDKKIKTFKEIEKEYESFNIKPKYRHLNTTPKAIGYIGELKYKLNSDKAIYMDDFITALTDLKRFRDTQISVNNLFWTVREETFNVTLDLLRLEAINWGKTYSKNLSNDLKESCQIKSIKIDKKDNFNDEQTPVKYERLLNSTKVAPIPEMEEERNLSITANYILECR
ncbi:hypothetical protein CRV08_07335 [Halarcobacter ebronensis]|uniref:SIMPL domain-containing protein n=1 Tax=Halarcobacter ebronensis TaxID=1462615 RepID=A0A4Q0YID5_9BACT|nr:hypothetical protein [Halarcobacter ebronensis]RXJ68631.1 hypothetical protein CRV08_07335 [Halarcobacter ebronensis]